MDVGCVPEDWLDTEQYMDIARQPVPDNQEILVEPLADSDTKRKPVMLFVDLQEMLDVPDLKQATLQHVDDILERMGERVLQSAAARVELVPSPRAVEREDNQSASAFVEVLLGAELKLTMFLVRVPRADVDIVLSTVIRRDCDASGPDMHAICNSLRVVDWGLFASTDK